MGTEEIVARGLQAFAERTGADELMLTSQIFDHRAPGSVIEIVSEGDERRPAG